MKNKISDLKLRDNIFTGFFRGIVEDRNDPEKLGRCRIRVFGVHTDIKAQTPTDGVPTDHLPWAHPVISTIEGGVTGFGLWSVPLQGSQVLVYFEEGNIMQPRYMASLPGRPEESSKGRGTIGFYDPKEKYPIDSKATPHEPNQKGENDMHKLATGNGVSDTIVKSKTDKKDKSIKTAKNGFWDEPDPYYGAKYPDNIVLATHSGIVIEVDNTESNERIHIYHPSNSYIEIGPKGDIVIRNAKDKFEIVDENKMVHIKGNLDETVDLDRTNHVKQTQTEKVVINTKEVVGNNKDVKIYGREVKKLLGTFSTNAPLIRLNCTTSEPDVPNL